MNTNILQKDPYSTILKDHLEQFFITNKDSVSNAATIWAAHKAYMRGIFIQQSSRARRKRSQRIDTLIKEIDDLDSSNKQKATNHLKTKLGQLRLELRSLLLDQFEFNHKRFKSTQYATGNKAGKFLSKQIKGSRTKSSIPFLYHPFTKEKFINPQDIANAFSTYYSSLYNLKGDPHTKQPTPSDITAFLQSIHLSTLSTLQLETLNSLFTTQEIAKAIKLLPINKAPGPDGFVAEYYKQFTPLLLNPLTLVF